MLGFLFSMFRNVIVLTLAKGDQSLKLGWLRDNGHGHCCIVMLCYVIQSVSQLKAVKRQLGRRKFPLFFCVFLKGEAPAALPISLDDQSCAVWQLKVILPPLSCSRVLLRPRYYDPTTSVARPTLGIPMLSSATSPSSNIMVLQYLDLTYMYTCRDDILKMLACKNK